MKPIYATARLELAPKGVKVRQESSSRAATVEVARYRKLGRIPQVFFYLFVCLAILVSVNYIFGLGIVYMVNFSYYYMLVGLLLPFVFLLFPARKGKFGKIPWHDWVAAFLAFVIPIYFSFHGLDIQTQGWSAYPSLLHASLSLVVCILVLDASRRLGGPAFLLIVFLAAIYPLFASHLGGIFRGTGLTLLPALGQFAFSAEGLMGIPMRVVGEILIGFLILAGILMRTGAGDFFLNLAMALAGHTRGGPAKIAVIGSAFFGSLSGSIFANVVGTGSVTIPAMKRIGYPPYYAGAVEACSSTGGVLMPPVMGAAAFVMAEITGTPYATIMVAAIIPSLLYYWGLLLQADAYAARVGLKGLPREELPSLGYALKQGWHFLFVLLFLVWGLIYMRWGATTPFYASGLLILLSMVRKQTRLNTLGKWCSVVDGTGKLLVETLGIILPVGLILGGLILTGVAPAFTATIVSLSHGIPFIALLFGAIACYLLGMVGVITAAYIFLAVTLAPALIMVGFNLLAVHLFCIYYSMLAAITPPVAIAAFLAGGIAGAPPMKTAFQAMRLGVVIYFIPFFFVFEPSLVLQGAPLDTLYCFSTCALGVVFIAGGLEGYLLGVGEPGKAVRPLLVIAGCLIAFPDWKTKALGACLAIPLLTFLLMRKRVLKIGQPSLKD